MRSSVVSYLTVCVPLCFALLLTTCSDDGRDNTCSVDDPAHDLPWLKTTIETYSNSNFIDVTVEQGVYHFKTVFIITPCCPTCYMIPPPVYTCEGTAIEGLDPFSNLIKNRKEIWKTPIDGTGCW